MPNFQFVTPRRDMTDLEVPGHVCQRKKARLQHDHDRAHFRVNLAENVGDAGLTEADFTGCPALIQTKVNRRPLMNRKHTVKEQILVGELDLRSPGHGKHMRDEFLVLLQQPGHWTRASRPTDCRGVSQMTTSPLSDSLAERCTTRTEP